MQTLKKILASLLIVSTFFFFAPPANAASISFVLWTGGLGASGSTDFGSVTNGLLVFQITSGSDDVTAVTVNSVAGVRRVHNTSNEATILFDIWTVAVGTMSGSVSWSITGGTGLSTKVASYSGVDQATPVNQSNQANIHNTSNTVSVSSTPSLDNTWAVAATVKNGACATDSAVNMFDRTGSGTNSLGIGDSNGTITNGVSYTQSITSSGCMQQMSINQIIIAPAAGGASTFSLWSFWYY